MRENNREDLSCLIQLIKTIKHCFSPLQNSNHLLFLSPCKPVTKKNIHHMNYDVRKTNEKDMMYVVFFLCVRVFFETRNSFKNITQA